MRILVLGGSRFVGRAIVEALCGDHEVSVLNRGTQPPPGPTVAQLVADRTDPRQVAGVLREDFDVVVDVSATEASRVANVLPQLRRSPGLHYVFIGSAAVYDRQAGQPPFREDHKADGDAIWGTYGEDKAACERLLREAFPGRLTVLRPPYVYGPRNTEPREQFLWARMLRSEPVFVPGDGSTRLQFLHADVLADIVLAACEGRLPVGTYNVGEEAAYSFREYLHILGQVAGVRTELAEIHDDAVRARDYFPFRNAELTLDVSKLAATGIVGDLPLAKGLLDTLDWFRRHDGLRFDPTPQEELWRRAGARPSPTTSV